METQQKRCQKKEENLHSKKSKKSANNTLLKRGKILKCCYIKTLLTKPINFKILIRLTQVFQIRLTAANYLAGLSEGDSGKGGAAVVPVWSESGCLVFHASVSSLFSWLASLLLCKFPILWRTDFPAFFSFRSSLSVDGSIPGERSYEWPLKTGGAVWSPSGAATSNPSADPQWRWSLLCKLWATTMAKPYGD